MTDDLEQLLKSLKLRKIAEILDEEIARAERESSTPTELLSRLFRAQWQANQESALRCRLDL